MAWISDKLSQGNRIRPLVLCIGMTIGSILSLLWLNEHVPSWIMIGISILLGFFGMGWDGIVSIWFISQKMHQIIKWLIQLVLVSP